MQHPRTRRNFLRSSAKNKITQIVNVWLSINTDRFLLRKCRDATRGLHNLSYFVFTILLFILSLFTFFFVFPKRPIQYRISIIILMCSIETHKSTSLSLLRPKPNKRASLELIHEQLPLPVPCYDFIPVIEFTVIPNELELQVLPIPLM